MSQSSTLKRTNPNWAAGILAGLIAGAVFIVMEMALVALVGGDSPWAPPRMIAAIVLGSGVLPPPTTFDLTIFVVAMAIHFVLAIVLGLVFALIAHRLSVNYSWWSMPVALLAGAIFGLAIYAINFYGLTTVFPWFAMARNAISIVSHVAFGVVLAGSYQALAR